MKRKLGFTLIELLAVIVILAIIALISTPIIIGVIDKARKGAFEDSAYGVLDAGKLYVVNKIADDNAFTGASFDFAGNVDHLKLSGDKPAGGKLMLDSDGKQGLALWDKDKRWCAYKEYAEEKITIKDYVEGECVIGAPVSGGTGQGAQSIVDKNTAGNTEGLYTDDKGNTRYAGNNTVVKNYVTFNNEKWRIIGVFDGKLKIMKEESVGTKQWNDTRASNNWATSTMQTYLNGEYYNSLTSEAKNMIEETKYYLGGHTASNVMKEAMYDYERGTTVYTGNQAEWTGKVALMYPSDYGYAASSECTRSLAYYENTTCKNNNWMYKTETGYEWLLTPRPDTSSYAFSMNSTGDVYSGGHNVTNSIAVRPVVHLRPDIFITGGDGTEEKPYILV